MQIPVLVEPIANGSRARTGERLGLSVEAVTADEAVTRVRELLATKVANGTGVVPVEVPGTERNPWLKMAGMFSHDDPSVQQWLDAMAENRRREDEEAATP